MLDILIIRFFDTFESNIGSMLFNVFMRHNAKIIKKNTLALTRCFRSDNIMIDSNVRITHNILELINKLFKVKVNTNLVKLI